MPTTIENEESAASVRAKLNAGLALGETALQPGAVPRLLSGAGAPAAGLGEDGDIYLDAGTDTLYGPKRAGAWGAALPGAAPISLVIGITTAGYATLESEERVDPDALYVIADEEA